MFELLLLPFMCLSVANESISKKGYIALNEITSYTVAERYKTKEYEEEWKKVVSASSTSTYTYEEKEGVNGNNNLRYAEELPVSEDGEIINGSLRLTGSLSSSDKTDMYYFCLPDRTNVWANFAGSIDGVAGAIYLDNPHDKIESILELGVKHTMSPNLYLPKGTYYLVVTNAGEENVNYTIGFSFACVTNISRESVTVNSDFVSKNKILVWESDFLPKNSDAVDGTVLYSYSTGRTSPGYKLYTPPKLGGLSYDGVYRYTLLWTKEDQKELRDEIEALKKILSDKNSEIGSKNLHLEIVSTIAETLEFVVGLFLPGATVPLATLQVLGTIIFSCLGLNYTWTYDNLQKQLERLHGSLDGASPGTAIFIREDAYVKQYRVKHTHGSIVTYKVKFKPHIEDETYSHVLRRVDEDPVKLDDHLNDISDCCGTFKYYDSLSDLPSLYDLEKEIS